jgi:NADH dehydrogenase
VIDDQGRAAPGIAPAAKQMGRYVGELIARHHAGGPSQPAFVYRHAGDLATIGRKAAVVKLDSVRLKGFAGWLFWSLAHVYFLIGVRNRLVVAFTWGWTYLTRQRGVRLITRAPSAGEGERPRQPPGGGV